MENRLPKGWEEFNISSLLDENAIFSDGDWVESKDQDPNGDVRLIQLADIGINEFRDKSNRYLTSQKAEELKCTLLKKNDVLIARMPDPIGRSCVFPLEGKFATVVDVAIVRINSKYINPRLLSFFTNSIYIQNKIRDLSSGSTRLRISRKNLDTIKFPLPPLQEQERIVAKLDALFSSIDIINSKIQRIENLNEVFFESVFYNNSGQKRLEGLLVESKDRAGKDWNKYRKIGVSAKNGIIDLDTGTKTSFENYKIVQPGDFIYNTMRIDIGSIAIYEDNIPAITSPDYVVFQAKNISKYLLLNYLKSKIGRKNISSLTTGSVRSRLYFKNLIQLPFPIISSEQHNKAESILKWFNSNIKKLWFVRDETLTNLKKAILDKAFKGELVPQLPTDGDAKDLLEEIIKLKKEVKKK